MQGVLRMSHPQAGHPVALVMTHDLELSFEHDGHGGYVLYPFVTLDHTFGCGELAQGIAVSYTAADVRQLAEQLMAVADRMEDEA